MELSKLMLKDKKGMSLGDIYPAVLTLVLIGIVLGIGVYILSSINTAVTDAEASTVINTTTYALGDFADWIPIIVVVIAAAIVLGIVLSSFGRTASGV
ncbi:MAG: hypothetical protein EHM47_00960 [Ignavibacteriales bacterium]|nr:MAG: hypothetical protein EHM47_00960 [Ignavibacteriales bacterium]